MKAVYQQVSTGFLEIKVSRRFTVIVTSEALHRLPLGVHPSLAKTSIT
jgi:hypothetical protein